ncbi:MAG: uroporphyrinogen decarboxylase family protein [Anaerolineae bacterium]
MTLQEDRLRSLNFDYPEHIPVSAYILPAAWIKYREALDELVARHPILFGPQRSEPRDYDLVSTPTYVAGEHVDAWGCVWSNLKTGMESIVTGHPVPTREDVHDLELPEEDIGFPHGFMYLRLQDLRGFEELMMDFAEEPPELQMLIDKVLAYNLRQAKLMLESLAAQASPDPIVYFGDDLGLQQRLPISPKMWRKYLKPCFAQIYGPFRAAGYYVYMHTDGHIYEIIPDLVDCGVNVVNPQVRANGLDNLAEVCKGKVCVDLDLDRQLFPFATPQQIDDHIRESVEILGSPEGGLWLKAEIGEDVPLENIAAIFNALETYRDYYG